VAIVTAAGRGMGAAVAKELAANDYQVALMSPSGAAEKLAESLDGLGLTGSVTEFDDIQGLVDATMAAYGRIDAVVNHSGHPPKGPLLEIPDADWHAGLDLIMLNVVRMARLVTPVLRRL
jgi:NAD(P)-dependent dehydrogenase (short-subunit alcohol dehydrogenase family)